jgi:sugar lactone lactonase YvrE
MKLYGFVRVRFPYSLSFPYSISPIKLFRDELSRCRVGHFLIPLLISGMTCNTLTARAEGVVFSYAQTTLVSLIAGAGFSGIAVDTKGNVFVADPSTNAVKEILAANGSIPANPGIRVLSSDFSGPVDVAVDVCGNVFVADNQNNAVKEILAVNGSIPASPTIKTLGSGFHFPHGVAVDAKGNLFVADSYNNAVKEMLAVDGSIPAEPTIKTLGSGFNTPNGLAVDASGNVFVADTYNSEVKEILAVEGSIPADPTIKVLARGIDVYTPWSVAVDAKGDVFVASVIGVLELPAVDGSVPANTTNIVPLGSFSEPQSIVLDQKGDAFVTDYASDTIGTIVTELQQGPFHFGTIAYGGSSALSLMVTNIGDGMLSVSPAVNGPSYIIAGSTCDAGLDLGKTCALQVQFSPVVIGPHNDILTLQTNVSAPTVGLKGVATGIGTEMEGPLEFGDIAFGTTKTIVLTITNSGVPGTVMVGTKINGPSYKVLATPENTCLAGITAGKSCTLPIEFNPLSVGVHDDRLTISSSAGTAAATVHLHGAAY